MSRKSENKKELQFKFIFYFLSLVTNDSKQSVGRWKVTTTAQKQLHNIILPFLWQPAFGCITDDKLRTERNTNDFRGDVLFTRYYHICRMKRITLNTYKMYFDTVNNYLLKKLSNDNWLVTVTFELPQHQKYASED